ncbi:hypothetical protein [Novipirellula caenicola]|uniref:Uncharacterized protein n=1 Tax=Novipirellula caenicola TaxID=1536901 RepID=A0ABP9VWW5_9BACT
MIKCKKDDAPYPLFSAFVFDWLNVLASGDLDAAESKIDEQDEGLLRERIELGLECDTQFTRPDDEKSFALHFYHPARDLGNDYTVEFCIPNTEMEYDTAFEFRKVRGGYKVVLVRL